MLPPTLESAGPRCFPDLEQLYGDHVAPQRSYCSQVFRQARLWVRLEKSVRAEQFTFPGDPMRLDYSYRRNGTRGFVQTLSVARAPADAKLFAYIAERIAAKAFLKTEFAAATDVALNAGNDRHRFVRDTLRDAGIEPIPLEGSPCGWPSASPFCSESRFFAKENSRLYTIFFPWIPRTR
jgi:hypothetical protein